MPNILLIEDNPDISFIYQDALEGAGHQVETAGDGEKGLEKAKQGSFDLILLDLMLPGRHGMSVLRELKRTDETKNVPVYVLSALSDGIVADQAYNTGADGFFVKSEYDPGELVTALEKIFSGEKPEQES
ncbi:response regulator [candidate division WWE3 bacterium]|uniref:Response regulator n=1 Tax=candidate division WWE3 bacterium TaxID=2053526 RepID=A0A955LHJ9_UNCKA|nr:response regulator [candidate division WWE3 bacterium]